jgi:hypothetical protein
MAEVKYTRCSQRNTSVHAMLFKPHLFCCAVDWAFIFCRMECPPLHNSELARVFAQKVCSINILRTQLLAQLMHRKLLTAWCLL